MSRQRRPISSPWRSPVIAVSKAARASERAAHGARRSRSRRKHEPVTTQIVLLLVVQSASASKSPEALELLAKRKPAVSSKKALA